MEMKKYITPEMEVVELKFEGALLSASTGEGTSGGKQELDPDDLP